MGQGTLAVGDHIYALSNSSDQMLIYNTRSGEVSGVDVSAVCRGEHKWSSGSFVDGKIYGIPQSASQLLVFDIATSSCSGVDTSDVDRGSSLWSGNVVLNGRIY